MITDIFDFNREIYFDGKNKYWQLYKEDDQINRIMQLKKPNIRVFTTYNSATEMIHLEAFPLEDFDQLVLSDKLNLIEDDVKAKLLLKDDVSELS